jgi:Bacterial regulatory proteins, luxR family
VIGLYEKMHMNLVNKEIGSRLNISERTVKFHVSNILSKFGVRRRADLILLCYQKRSLPSASNGRARPMGETMCSLSEDQSFEKNIVDRTVASPPVK